MILYLALRTLKHINQSMISWDPSTKIVYQNPLAHIKPTTYTENNKTKIVQSQLKQQQSRQKRHYNQHFQN